MFTSPAAPVRALVYEPVADSKSRINSGHLCCTASKCSFHMSLNWTCAEHRCKRTMDSCNKVLLWRYRSTKQHTLHTTPQKIVERCQIWRPRNWCPSTSSSILICNIEVIPHISIKVRRWLKGCIPAVLGHQNDSQQIVSPVHSQTSSLYTTQTVRCRTGVPIWTMISLPSCTAY